VLTKLEHVRAVATEAEQLYVGAIIDRDLRSPEQVEAIEAMGAFVLPVTEIENLFLEPALVGAIAAQAGLEPEAAQVALRDIADQHAGRWAFEKASTENVWKEDLGPASGHARSLTLVELQRDPLEVTKEIAGRISGLSERELAQRAQQMRHSLAAWQSIRQDPTQLWRVCFGKEVLNTLAHRFGLTDAESYERRAVRLWRSAQVTRPAEAAAIQEYIENLPLTGR
jgi:hypothetical protein